MERFFADVLQRLTTLQREAEQAIDGLPPSALDWVPGPDMNSLAVLVVHLTGSQRYWIGDVAAGEPSGRDREAEFRVRGLTEADLRERLAASLDYSRGALERFSLRDLQAERVAPGEGKTYTVGWALAHALEHSGIHVGHIQLVRQLLEQHREAWFGFTTPEEG